MVQTQSGNSAELWVMIQRRILIAMSPARGSAKEGPPEDHVAEDGGEGNEADGKDLERH